MKRASVFYLFILIWSVTVSNCGRIGFEIEPLDTLDTSSGSDTLPPRDTQDSENDTESADSADSGTANDTASSADTLPEDSDTDTNTGSDTGTDIIDTESDSSTGSGTDTGTGSNTDSDTETASDIDTGSDTGSDTGIDTGSDPGSDTGSDIPCPTIPANAGTELLSGDDAADFSVFGPITASYVTVSGQTFNNAWQLTTGADVNNPTAAQLQHLIPSDILAGDHLVVEFWTQCVSSTSGECRTGMLMEESAAPWTKAAEYYPAITSSWTFHQIPLVSSSNFAADNTQITFRLGYTGQVVKIYPSRVINYGQLDNVARVDCLDNTTTLLSEVTFTGTEPSTAWVDFPYQYWVEINALPAATLSATGLPYWLKLDQDRNLIYGSPSYADVGASPVISLTAENTTDTASDAIQINVAIPPFLAGHWPLDESAGTTAADVSGNGATGTVWGDPVWQPSTGQLGGALTLDGYIGSLDYVELPSTPALDDVQRSEYTLMAWVRPRSIPAGANTTDNNYAYGIILKSNPPTGLYYNSNQDFVVSHEFASVSKQAVNGPYAPGTFYHVAAVLDLAFNALVLFVNGESVAAVYYNDGEPVREYGSAPWRLGIADPGASSSRWEADIDIDDVRIYSRKLSAVEIRSIAGL